MLGSAPKTSSSISKFENPKENLYHGSYVTNLQTACSLKRTQLKLISWKFSYILKMYIFSKHIWDCAFFSKPLNLFWRYSDKILTLFRRNIHGNSEFCRKLKFTISFQNSVSITLKSNTFHNYHIWRFIIFDAKQLID